MATICYFDEMIKDQHRDESIALEFGRSSLYSGGDVTTGEGEDSIYIRIDGKAVVMTLEMAGKFVNAAIAVGRYHRLID